MPEPRPSLHPLRGSSVLCQSAFFSLALASSQRLVIFSRTARPFQSLEEVESTTTAVRRALPHENRQGLVTLIDMRQAPLRVHPALDPAFERLRSETQKGFARVAVVVGTPLGRVRADRLAGASIPPVPHVVTSLTEALEYLTAPSP